MKHHPDRPVRVAAAGAWVGVLAGLALSPKSKKVPRLLGWAAAGAITNVMLLDSDPVEWFRNPAPGPYGLGG